MPVVRRSLPDSSGGTASIFLVTKITPPRDSSRWVRRPRLLARLGVPARHRVILVHAGPGYGKTALLAQWQHDLTLAGVQVAWLSVDPKDDNLHFFIAYLSAAINRACPEVGRDVIELIGRSGPLAPPDTLLAALVNAIANLDAPVVLIVDDFHFLGSSGIQAWMTEFAGRAPENLSIAVAARSFPPQRLSRLRATGQVEEIGPGDLALTFEEVREYMHAAAGTTLGVGVLDTLHQRTEGWAAGLQMVAIALRGKRNVASVIESFSGAARSVSGYLQEEVFATLPQKLRDFLMRTSILDRMCAELCAAVAAEPDATRLIEEVERRELFILPLDDQGRWYRCHHLFVDFLAAELARQHPEELSVLHARASEWFAAEGQWREAVHHALEAGDVERAVELANLCAMNLVRDGDYFVLQSLLARLPDDLRRRSVTLRLAECWAFALIGQDQVVERLLGDIEAAPGAGDAPDGLEPEIRAIHLTAAYVQDDSERMSRLLRGDRAGGPPQPWVADVLKCAASIDDLWHLRLANARDYSPCATPFKRVFQLVQVGRSWWYEGRLAEAEASWHAAADLADEEAGAQSLAALLPRIMLSRIDYENGRFDGVERVLSSRIAMLEQVCTTDLTACAMYSLAWSRAARGSIVDAVALFDRMRVLGAERGWVRLEASAIIELLRLTADIHDGRAAQLSARLQAIGPAVARNEFSTHWLGARLCALGTAFHRARTSVGDDAVRSLESVVRDLVERAPPPDAVTAELLLARVLHERSDRRGAREVMARALVRAQDLDLARSLVDSGAWAMALVRDIRGSAARSQAVLRDEYLDRILSVAGGHPGPVVAAPTAAAVPQSAEALTVRERDILSLLGRGLSNKDIGRLLQIGPETVKWHLKNIFGKLGVATRYEAMRCAQAVAAGD